MGDVTSPSFCGCLEPKAEGNFHNGKHDEDGHENIPNRLRQPRRRFFKHEGVKYGPLDWKIQILGDENILMCVRLELHSNSRIVAWSYTIKKTPVRLAQPVRSQER